MPFVHEIFIGLIHNSLGIILKGIDQFLYDLVINTVYQYPKRPIGLCKVMVGE